MGNLILANLKLIHLMEKRYTNKIKRRNLKRNEDYLDGLKNEN
jgi:hypothetical protein